MKRTRTPTCLWRFHRLPFKCSVRFSLFFERSPLCSSKLHLFDQKYSKNCNIVKYYYKVTVFYFNVFSNVIYSCDQSYIFSIFTPVFRVTQKYADLLLKKHFWLAMLKTVSLLYIFVTFETVIHLSLLSLLIKSMHPCLKKGNKWGCD